MFFACFDLVLKRLSVERVQARGVRFGASVFVVSIGARYSEERAGGEEGYLCYTLCRQSDPESPFSWVRGFFMTPPGSNPKPGAFVGRDVFARRLLSPCCRCFMTTTRYRRIFIRVEVGAALSSRQWYQLLVDQPLPRSLLFLRCERRPRSPASPSRACPTLRGSR